jgi:DNA adenine methylase
MNTLKPVISWPGGKRRLLKAILPLFRPHTCYVEPFAGGLAVLLAKERSPVEVVNDLNGDLVSLYRCAQFHLDALVSEIQWTISSRQNLRDLIAQPGLTEIQRAARFLLRNRMSFAGGGSSYAVSKATGMTSRERVIAALKALSARLDKVSVEQGSYDRILSLYDSAKSLFFCDPPYVKSDVANYHGFTEAQMTDFTERMDHLQGDWIVTVDDAPLNRQLFRRHDITPVETRNGAVNQRTHGQAKFGELIIRRRRSRAVMVAAVKPVRMAA